MNDPLEILVPPVLDGQRLDRVVSLETGLSRSAVAKLVDAGEITLDGEVVSQRSVRLEIGQTIRLVLPAEAGPVRLTPDASIAFDVLYEDEHLVVVDKPADAVVHPGSGRTDHTLVHGLLHRYPEIEDVGEADRPGIVHRLDRGTSGAMVVARTGAAYEALVALLGRHEVERVYWTLVRGVPDSGSGTIEAPIGRSSRRRTSMAVVADGRPAVTHYTVLERFDRPIDLALLDCRLETGRTHQIRVHFSSIGHPVVGDTRYGPPHGPFDGLDRMALHARRLGFVHPITAERLVVDAPLPDALVQLRQRLGGGST